MATKQTIRNRVLRRLKALPAGQTADSEDAQIVEDAYDSLHAYLTERDVITWGSTDDIPLEAEEPIIKLVADSIADEFLSKADENFRIRLGIQAYGLDGSGGAFGDLQRLSAVDYIPQAIEADYF
jgi:hypothetical protein